MVITNTLLKCIAGEFFTKRSYKIDQKYFEGTKRQVAKGGCEDCIAEQIKAAIEYIVLETKN